MGAACPCCSSPKPCCLRADTEQMGWEWETLQQLVLPAPSAAGVRSRDGASGRSPACCQHVLRASQPPLAARRTQESTTNAWLRRSEDLAQLGLWVEAHRPQDSSSLGLPPGRHGVNPCFPSCVTSGKSLSLSVPCPYTQKWGYNTNLLADTLGCRVLS